MGRLRPPEDLADPPTRDKINSIWIVFCNFVTNEGVFMSVGVEIVSETWSGGRSMNFGMSNIFFATTHLCAKNSEFRFASPPQSGPLSRPTASELDLMMLK